MLTHRLNKEYTMYDKMLKCPRPSVTCKKGALSACDFLPEKCTSSICHGELQEIVKAGTRRFFRSTFQSRPGIIYPPITCYYLCFDLVVKSLFLAVFSPREKLISRPVFTSCWIVSRAHRSCETKRNEKKLKPLNYDVNSKTCNSAMCWWKFVDL